MHDESAVGLVEANKTQTINLT